MLGVLQIGSCIIAQLSDTPTEIILNIASFLQPGVSPSIILRSWDGEENERREKDSNTVKDSVEDEADGQADDENDEEDERIDIPILSDDQSLSIRSFARTNKRCHQAVTGESYRSVSITGRAVPQKVMSLLRLASENLLIRNSVRQICLWLTPDTYNEPCIPHDDLPFLRLNAFWRKMHYVFRYKTTAVDGSFSDFAGTSVLVGQSGGYQGFFRLSTDQQSMLETAVYRFAPEAFLLLSFPNLEDLGLSLSADLLGLILRVLLESPVRLSALRSLTLSALPCLREPLEEELDLQIHDMERLLQVAPGITDLFIRGFDFLALSSDSLTSLGLRDICIEPNTLMMIMSGCRNLARFTFTAFRPTPGPLDPSELVLALVPRADTLRTIWVNVTSGVSDTRYVETDTEILIHSLRQFTKLENLWLDLGTFAPHHVFNPEGLDGLADATDEDRNEDWNWGNALLRTLPASLKRLHIWYSCMDRLYSDLEWLALHNTNLREVAFEMPSSGHYLYDLFENAGIKALRRVDDEPVMW
ncbi:hypothetical protein CMUS01_12920 [Colletotrichum musicola]|uniref:Uncharacterized protein n=1 Tax=Colletotrichum musicola TaxID=2175873 RepID=A0A8H6MXW1_9PEZI|nr:hypothetical protein CMUS01_12920 [Colletotrichum musicola]